MKCTEFFVLILGGIIFAETAKALRREYQALEKGMATKKIILEGFGKPADVTCRTQGTSL